MNFSMMPFGSSALASKPVVGRDARGDDAVGHRNLVPGRAGERLVHEEYPGRERRARALLALAQRAILIEAGPDGRHDVAVEAREPGVVRIVGGAGLAGDVVAIERRARAARCRA